MPQRSPASARWITYLWFLTSVFSIFAVILRYRRTGEITWYLVAAAVFAFVMGLTSLKRSVSK